MGNINSNVVHNCRVAFQCRSLLCTWHLRRAWMRSLLKKCCNIDVQREMFKHLGWILYSTRSGSNADDAVEEFMQVYVDQCIFMDYFKRRWLPYIGICFLSENKNLCFVEESSWCNFFFHVIFQLSNFTYIHALLK